MNARFAAVALTSCLSVLLASQLFPLPTLMSLMDTSEGGEAPIPGRSTSTLDSAATFALALQANAAPQASDAPQLIEPLRVIDAPRAVDAPRSAAALQSVGVATAAAAPQFGAAEVGEIASATVTPPVVMDRHAGTTSAAPVAAAVDVDNTATAEQGRTPEPAGSLRMASADPSEMLPAETAATLDTPASVRDHTPETPTADDRTASVNATDVADECFIIETCVDRYLWALYQRAPKEDSIKVHERRSVTVKRKGRTVTVARTFTRLVDEDFTWKDPKAADKASLSLMDYVIGGMDRGFKLKLFYTLHAAEAAGLSPGITSAFRDDYRQSIASGLKAASDRSYHGGSFRGGYGHGLAADIVSVKGATRAERWTSTEQLWKWIDVHGQEFGIGRPYLDRDPPHVAPIDGQEYASHRGPAVRHVVAEANRRKHLAARREHGAGKHVRAARATAIRSARAARSRAT
ncbi:hypothetical protein [Bradyrhizobium sp. SZCCHNR3054]|uniref:hypothetical protein n=1 Tax=unclassified Bradyrhizobium TaxID=2631580 RepID=UPI0039672AFC